MNRVATPTMSRRRGSGLVRKRIRAGLAGHDRLGGSAGLPSSQQPSPSRTEKASAQFFWREAAYYCGLAEAMDDAGLRDMAVELTKGCEAAARKLEKGARTPRKPQPGA